MAQRGEKESQGGPGRQHTSVEDRAFRLASTIDQGNPKVTLERAVAQADQGSNMNLVSKAFLDKLGVVPRELKSIGFAGMAMRTAEGRTTPLSQYVILVVGVQGIWQSTLFFIRPSKASAEPEVNQVLLGLPWLHFVDATLCIRNSSIIIGDKKLGETPRAQSSL